MRLRESGILDDAKFEELKAKALEQHEASLDQDPVSPQVNTFISSAVQGGVRVATTDDPSKAVRASAPSKLLLRQADGWEAMSP